MHDLRLGTLDAPHTGPDHPNVGNHGIGHPRADTASVDWRLQVTSILTWLLSMDWCRLLTWWGPGAVVWGRSIVAYCCSPAAVLPSVLVASTAFAGSVTAVTAAENDSATSTGTVPRLIDSGAGLLAQFSVSSTGRVVMLCSCPRRIRVISKSSPTRSPVIWAWRSLAVARGSPSPAIRMSPGLIPAS